VRALLMRWSLSWATAYGAIRLARDAMAEMQEETGSQLPYGKETDNAQTMV
jgi:hypothetical protein